MNILDRKTDKKLVIILSFLVVTALTSLIIIILAQPQPIKIGINPTQNINIILPELDKTTLINSRYPESTPAPFVYPPATIAGLNDKGQYDPYKDIEQSDADLIKGSKAGISKPGGRRVHGVILPLIGMNVSVGKFSTPQFYTTLTLDKSRPFEGVAETVPYYSQEPFYSKDENKAQGFVIKALLDGKEIQLGIKGSPLNKSIELHLASGERSLIEFETEALPLGVHEIVLFSLDFITDTKLDPGSEVALGKYALRAYPYKVFVGTGISQTKFDWFDWSIGVTPFPNLDKAMTLLDLEKTTQTGGFVDWKPGIYQPNQKIDYKIGLNNAGKGDREYCLIAFLDFNVINIQADKKQICGIVKEGQWGIVNGSLTTPEEPGSYRLEVLQLENPLMKESYIELKANEQLLQTQASGYFVIKVEEK
jgi:hypothetical protein